MGIFNWSCKIQKILDLQDAFCKVFVPDYITWSVVVAYGSKESTGGLG